MLIPNFPAPFPLTEGKMRAFIEYYRITHPNTTYGYLRQFIAGFSYHLRSNNLPLLTQNPDFLQYVQGLKRTVHSGKNPKAKLPITTDIFKKISQTINKDSEIEVSVMTIISMCFYGFLRLSECLALKHDQISIEEERIVITIEISKTNQTGKEEKVFIHNSSTNYSPFVWYPIHIKNGTSSIDPHVFQLSQSQFRYY